MYSMASPSLKGPMPDRCRAWSRVRWKFACRNSLKTCMCASFLNSMWLARFCSTYIHIHIYKT